MKLLNFKKMLIFLKKIKEPGDRAVQLALYLILTKYSLNIYKYLYQRKCRNVLER